MSKYRIKRGEKFLFIRPAGMYFLSVSLYDISSVESFDEEEVQHITQHIHNQVQIEVIQE